MFGVFCKGLHCAGCGRGIPASVLLLLGGIAIASLQASVIIMGLIILIAILAGAGIISLIAYRLFMTKGPAVVHVRQGMSISYSQQKFLETGDPEWLELMGPFQMPETKRVIKAEVVRLDDAD